jgi:hypothetical protein
MFNLSSIWLLAKFTPVPFFSAPFRVDYYLCLGLLGFSGNVAILTGFGLRHPIRQEMLCHSILSGPSYRLLTPSHCIELVEQVPFSHLNLSYLASNPLIMSQRSELSSFQMILRLLLGFAIGLSLPGLFVNAVLRASDITSCPNTLPEMSNTLVMQSKMSTGNWGRNSTVRQCRAKASSKIPSPPTARSHPLSVPAHMGVRYTRPKNLDAVI